MLVHIAPGFRKPLCNGSRNLCFLIHGHNYSQRLHTYVYRNRTTFLISQELQNKEKLTAISSPTESTGLTEQTLEVNPGSGENIVVNSVFSVHHVLGSM